MHDLAMWVVNRVIRARGGGSATTIASDYLNAFC